MCGILCICHCSTDEGLTKELVRTWYPFEQLQYHFFPIHFQIKGIEPQLLNRGPDSSGSIVVDDIHFQGSVLWQQGSTQVDQPVYNDDLVLLLNGDIFQVPENIPDEVSDTTWLFNALRDCEVRLIIITPFRHLYNPFNCRPTMTLWDSSGKYVDPTPL